MTRGSIFQRSASSRKPRIFDAHPRPSTSQRQQLERTDGTPAYSSTSNCASSSTCTAAVASAASGGTAVASEGEVVLWSTSASVCPTRQRAST